MFTYGMSKQVVCEIATTFGGRKEAKEAAARVFRAAGDAAKDARRTSQSANEAAARDAKAAESIARDLARRPADLERFANLRTFDPGSTCFAASASVASTTA